MAEDITWLHLSDLHSCKPTSGWDAARVIEALLTDLQTMTRDHHLYPDFVFFTGDAAFGQIGNKNGELISHQFRVANEFLSAVRHSFVPEIPQLNLFLVPGNHDVNRQLIVSEDTDWLANAISLDEMEKSIRDCGSKWKQVMTRLSDYGRFLDECGYHHLLVDRQRLIYATLRDVRNLRVGIAGFNSTWSSRGAGREEIGRLWMAGRYQLETLRQQLPANDLSIALVHHPGNWLVAEENPRFFRELRRDFQFVLHGHEHEDFVQPDASNGHTVISAGACHEWSQGKNNGYSFVRLNLEQGTGEVWLREYDSRGGGWKPRVIHGRTDDNGVWPLNHLDRWLDTPSFRQSKTKLSHRINIRPWNVPFARNPYFTERQEALQTLFNRLHDPARYDGVRVEGVYGLGGCGKTQVAVEYAHRFRENYKAVFWIRAGSTTQIRESIKEVASELGIPDRGIDG